MTDTSISDQIAAHFAARGPAEEMQDTINAAVWHAAHRTLGAQEISLCGNSCCADPDVRTTFDQAKWLAEREDAALRLRLHLLCIELANGVGLDPIGWVGNARKVGATWQQIGDALGTTRQAAHERFARFADDYSGNVGD